MKKIYNLCNTDKKMDFHVHPRPNCFSEKVLREVIIHAINHNVSILGLLEHGERISPRHKGILVDNESINRFMKTGEKIKKEFDGKIDIYFGIEMDYSPNKEFMKKNFEMIQHTDINYVVGSVHGYNNKSYKDYIFAILDLIYNYPIDILGHFVILENMNDYQNMLEQVLKILKERNILLEINLSPRYHVENYIYNGVFKLIEYYGVNTVYGSDAHHLCEMK